MGRQNIVIKPKVWNVGGLERKVRRRTGIAALLNLCFLFLSFGLSTFSNLETENVFYFIPPKIRLLMLWDTFRTACPGAKPDVLFL